MKKIFYFIFVNILIYIIMMHIVNILSTTPLSTEEVLHELHRGTAKIIISNDEITSQFSWAPDNKIEIVTINNKTGELNNWFFKKFDEIETINWIRKTFPTEDFLFGFIDETEN